MSEEELVARALPYAQPCTSGGPPGGVDVRYDPQFEAVQTEIAKLETPQSGPPRWAFIEQETATILLAKSKDILVACWFAAALHETKGLEGLVTGLAVVGSMVDTFWEGLFPPANRMRARASAVTWLVGRTTQKLEAHSGPLEHTTVERLITATKRLQRLMPERFGEHAPGIRPVADALERLRLSLPPRADGPAAAPAEPAPAAPAPPAAPATAAPAEASSSAAPAPAKSASDTKTDRIAILEARAAPFLKAVEGAKPGGEDLRYDPEHEALVKEIAKLEDPAGGAPSWRLVIDTGTRLLQTRTKDVLLLSYLAAALLDRDGLDGLATGLIIAGGVIGGFWDGLFPQRVRARANALSWLVARIEAVLAFPTPPKGASDREVVERLEMAARSFASVVRDKFADEAPGLSPLLQGVERLKLSLPVAAPPPPPAPVAAAPVAPSAAAPTPAASAAPMPAAVDLAAGADITPFLQQSGTALVNAAKMLRGANVGDATSYRLLRTGLYLSLAGPPPAATAPKTAIRAPQANQRQQLATLQQNGKWAPLLDEAESAIPSNRFWLDLHRYVAVSLGGLGHAAAADAVAAEIAYLAKRFPSLLELQFNDGTPFATPDTVEWVGTLGGGSGGARPAAGAAGPDPTDDAIAEARALATGGKRDDALKALQAAIRAAPDARSIFRLRLAVGRICTQGALPTARGIFAGLTREIDAMRLDLWDPQLAAEALRAHYDALKDAVKTNPRIADESAEVYGRLCRLDPLVAIVAGG